MPYINPPIIAADEAAALVRNGMTLSVNTMSAVSYPDALSKALRKRFDATGEPRDLCFWGSTAQAMNALDALTEQLARCEGMFSKVIMGHWSTTPTFVADAAANKFAAYNFPQGVISHLYRAAAGKKPVVVSRVGLGTFADPRYGGGKMNARAVEDYVDVVRIDGKEYLQYRTPKIDVCFVRGTTADPMGNITVEKEAAYIDALQLVLATKANGGTVIVQVERISARKAYCKEILIPYVAVDYIVVDSEQRQTYIEPYNSAYSGQTIMPAEHINAHMQSVLEKSGGFFAPRELAHYIIARRAAEELQAGFVVNIGIGIPGLIPAIAAEKGIQDQIHMTNEAGTIGGIPAPAGSFGASLNPVYMTDMSTMFDLYDGGMLDLVCVGAAQIDFRGNVNVGTIGPKVVGVGGFVNLTQASRKVVFLTTFTTKGLKMAYEDSRLEITAEGNTKKFVDKLDQISFNGGIAMEEKRKVLYVTERCVFQLTPEGLQLIEVAPGVDVRKDIIEQMEFKPLLAENLKVMDKDFFRI
ncbi:MAG: CoA-transferase [Pseudomonadota bacterium]